MQRTNIYLDDDQLRLLKHLAAEENKPVADLGGTSSCAVAWRNDVTWRYDMTALIERVQSCVPRARSRRY